MRRLGALFGMVCAVALGGCGGGDDTSARVEAYIKHANAIQARFAADFKRDNDAYIAYSRGRMKPARAVAALRRSERDIAAVRRELGALRPPAEARRLHALMLDYLDRTVAFARQTALLPRYLRRAPRVLASLPRVNRQLQVGLHDAQTAADQAGALTRFAGALRRMAEGLRALTVPDVLAHTHRDQLHRLTVTRTLALRLRRAVLAQDSQGVARLLLRFRRSTPNGATGTGLAARAIARYDDRYRTLSRAYGAVRREQGRLDRSFRS